MTLLLSRRMLLLAAVGALLGLAGAPDIALAKSGSGSGGGGSGGGDGGGDSSGKGGGDDGGGDDGGDADGGGKHGGHGKHNDHKRAKDAVKNGSARPLPEILGVVSQKYPGKVIDVSLKRRSKVLMYDVKLITPEGKLIRVRVDAETAVILGIQGI